MQYDRTDVSEGIDINKTSASKESDICHYWYFEDIGYKISTICLQWLSWYIKDGLWVKKNIAILNVKCVDYRCVLWNMSKNDTN